MQGAILYFGACDLSAEQEAMCEDVLGAQERLRVAGIRSPRRRKQFLAGRFLARQGLSRLKGGDPARYELTAEPGRPIRILGPVGADKDCYLSISHSQDLVACLASVHPCGIDVEDTRFFRNFSSLAKRVFGPDRDEPGSDGHGFYRRWCLHEAALKAGTKSDRLALFSHGSYQGALALSDMMPVEAWSGRIPGPFEPRPLELEWTRP